MEENKNALDEINKGCTMGIKAIKSIIDKVGNKDFKKELEQQLTEYNKSEDKINKIYKKYSNKEPHEASSLAKTMTDYMISLKTMMDHSDSKIAEILLQGTNMGIIEGRKILNNKKIADEVKALVKDFVTFQEKAIENIKKYL